MKKQTFLESTVNNLKEELNSLNETLPKLRKNREYSMYKNLINSYKEILGLISHYDWQINFSEYSTEENGQEVKQVAIWEQNSDGNIRNHKVWNVENDNKQEKTVSKTIYYKILILVNDIEKTKKLFTKFKDSNLFNSKCMYGISKNKIFLDTNTELKIIITEPIEEEIKKFRVEECINLSNNKDIEKVINNILTE